MKILLLIGIVMIVQELSFKEKQLQHSRVKLAYEEKEKTVQRYFENSKLPYKGFSLFIRAFKAERIVEAWVKAADESSYTLLTSFPFCATSGELGPKRKEGDLQIPEGIYTLNHFNPQSNFYLSLGVNYPNASDKILSDKKSPGSAIYIHGNCVTIGCIPLTDDKIKELYILAVEARSNGQKNIFIHIFPSRLDGPGYSKLQSVSPKSPHLNFWENLKTIFEDFEKTKTLKNVKVNAKGEYCF
jgi:murein L,D-transpeptidase YafK